MLIELVVEELGVIERAELSLDAGSAALTGETGAGKTLLVAALGLLMGGRADKDLVRHGATQARVEGRFLVRPDHPCALVAAEQDLIDLSSTDDDPVELVLSRVVPGDGKPSKARVNGRIVTLAILGEIGRSLVGIAGQNEHQRLGDPVFQRKLLDISAGAAELAADVAASVRAAAAARRSAEELRDGERARSRELDVLRYEIGEIEAVGVAEGEGDMLLARAQRLENAEEIAGALAGAADSIDGDGGALEDVAGAIAGLGTVHSQDRSISELIQRLRSVEAELGDISSEIARSAVIPDPESLADIRERIGDLQRLRRKYGADDAAVLAYLEEARERAAGLESTSSRASELEAEAAEQLERASSLAAELTERRRVAARMLEEQVANRLSDLALAGATFGVALEPRDLYEGGLESVTFNFAGGPGQVPRSLSKTASGGELSRVALALYLVTATSDVETMLFDEVDAGVGGEAARSVGQALAELARSAGVQTLVVTHLPQVAAYADVHLRVTKEPVAGKGVVSSVTTLSPEERVDELSRMLAGLPDSQVAQEHARELLDLARSGAPAV
jgi:DNA repair protein RecN (Recombination protein N)